MELHALSRTYVGRKGEGEDAKTMRPVSILHNARLLYAIARSANHRKRRCGNHSEKSVTTIPARHLRQLGLDQNKVHLVSNLSEALAAYVVYGYRTR
jgi:hypothetical protein